MLTGISCLILGIWFRLGYCFFTDWKWQIKRKQKENDLLFSFIKYVIDQIPGGADDPFWVNIITAVSLGIVAIISILINIWDRQKRKKARTKGYGAHILTTLY